MRTGRNRFWIVLLVVFFISCGTRDKDLIPRRKFIHVLADLHIADAIAMKNMDQSDPYRLDSASLYAAVFSKHAVTRAMFDSTVRYYTARPEEFQKLYNQVIAELKKSETEQNPTPEMKKQEEIIWQDSSAIILPQMGNANKVHVDIPVSGPGYYTVSADIQMFSDDNSLLPRMTVYFYYDNKSPEGYRDYFQEMGLSKDGIKNTLAVTKRLADPNVTHIRGSILNYSNPDSISRQHAVVSMIKVVKR
jgi:hypothetical protein